MHTNELTRHGTLLNKPRFTVGRGRAGIDGGAVGGDYTHLE